MKTKSLLFYLLWLLAAVLCMPLVSCGGDDDEEEVKKEEDNKGSEREKHIDTWTFAYWKVEGRSLIGYENSKPQRWVIWGNKGAYFNIYLIQDSKFYYAGWVHSNDTILTEEERESKDLTFNVDLPSNISRDKPYNVVALGYYDVDAALKNNTIECNADLVRDWKFRVWNHGNDTYPGGRPSGAKSALFVTYEGVLLRNNSDEKISVRHKGFEVAEKWYYTKAVVNITPDLKTEPVGSSTTGDVTSEVEEVEPGENGWLTSLYVPTGKKMTNARLVLDINGREVKTEPISSDMEIECGKFYRMVVKWDGKKLEWVLDNDHLGRDGEVITEIPDIHGMDI